MTSAKARITDTGPGQIERIIASLKGASVTVGVHEREGGAPVQTLVPATKYKKQHVELVKNKDGSQKYRAAEDTASTETVASVATKHELGLEVPQRSWLGAWVDENEPKVREQLQRVAMAAARRGRPVSFGLERLGAWSAGQVKRRIIGGISPELSERRKREKAAVGAAHKDTPLIFTGQFLSSIMSRLEDRKR